MSVSAIAFSPTSLSSLSQSICQKIISIPTYLCYVFYQSIHQSDNFSIRTIALWGFAAISNLFAVRHTFPHYLVLQVIYHPLIVMWNLFLFCLRSQTLIDIPVKMNSFKNQLRPSQTYVQVPPGSSRMPWRCAVLDKLPWLCERLFIRMD